MNKKWILGLILFCSYFDVFACDGDELPQKTEPKMQPQQTFQQFDCGKKLFEYMLSVMNQRAEPCVLVLDIDDNLAVVPTQRPLPTNWPELVSETHLAQQLEIHFDAWKIYMPYVCFVSSRYQTPEMLAISIEQLTRLIPKTFAYAQSHHFSPNIPADIEPTSPLHGLTHGSHVFHMGPPSLDPKWKPQVFKSQIIEALLKRHAIPLGTRVMFADDTIEWHQEARLRRCTAITDLCYYREIALNHLLIEQRAQEEALKRTMQQQRHPTKPEAFVPVDTDSSDDEEDRLQRLNERLKKLEKQVET